MNSTKLSQSSGARALVAAVGLALSPAAWSLGLGDVEVESFLNQPLRARIDLLTQANDDVASVTAKLASAADYELIGASRESVSVPIRFSVEDIDGDAYLLATSNLPIGDPIVRLIVEVNWSSGRMLREYTLFLDPPMVPEAAPAPAPRIDTRTQAASPAPPPSTEPAPAPAVSRPSAPSPTASALAGGSEYGPVRSGETLWRIASDWAAGSGLDVNRVMIAIQRENPEAFLNDNINLLKRGAILRMPERPDVEAITAAAAYREVVEQEEAFSGASRPTPTVASPATPLLAEEAAPVRPRSTPETPDESVVEEPTAAEDAASVAEASTDAETVADSGPGSAASEARDVLELVPPSPDSDLDSAYGFEETEDAGGASTDVEALRENLARAEEDLINQQQQNAYLEERIRELEDQLASAEEDGVAEADLANMEARLQAERQAAAQAQARAERSSTQPWYTRWWAWLLGLAVVVAVVVGWLFSRREPEWETTAEESLRDIKSEAEDVLRVLADDSTEDTDAEEQAAETEDEDSEGGDAVRVEDEEEVEPEASSGKQDFGHHEADAELLDEDSSDPEIQLDLARAYISMGDKEAARVILEEVVNNGSDSQQNEARKMLDLLA